MQILTWDYCRSRKSKGEHWLGLCRKAATVAPAAGPEDDACTTKNDQMRWEGGGGGDEDMYVYAQK